MPPWLDGALDWLSQTYMAGVVPFDVALGRLIGAAILGGAVAAVYAFTHRPDATPTRGFLATLVLLSIILAAVVQVIGRELALAFGLVGALSIVRFRTVVEDTRDTAFVILAVVVGMALGTGLLPLALATLAVCAIAAFLMQRRLAGGDAPDTWSLVLRAGLGHDLDAATREVFAKHIAAAQLVGIATVRQGAAVEQSWLLRLRPDATAAALLADLNRLEGVQGVEMKRTLGSVSN